MSGTDLFDEVLKRTGLSRSNQMEMLTFRLSNRQLYGINVFKIIEVTECPHKLEPIQHSNQAVKGTIYFRGAQIMVIDLSEALEMEATLFDSELAYLVVCEFSRQVNAFLIKSPEALLTRGWDEIHTPDGVQAKSLTAVAYSDSKETILLLDIEGILAEVCGYTIDLKEVFVGLPDIYCQKQVLLVDDSRTALVMMQQTLNRIGLTYTSCRSAVQALDCLKQRHCQGEKAYDLIISDIEMPEMDGFTFVRLVRALPEYEGCQIILHSSMSTHTTRLKAREAGADQFVAKFDPNSLAEHIMQALEQTMNDDDLFL